VDSDIPGNWFWALNNFDTNFSEEDWNLSSVKATRLSLRATAVRQVPLWRVLAMAILSVCPSVRLSRPGTDSRPR